MAKPFRLLRDEMYHNQIDQPWLARKMNRSISYVNERFTGKKPWTLDEAYWLLELFDISSDRLAEFFPPNGIELTPAKKPVPIQRRYLLVEEA